MATRAPDAVTGCSSDGCHIEKNAGAARGRQRTHETADAERIRHHQRVHARDRPDRQRERQHEPVVSIRARILDHQQVREIGRANRHQPVGDACVFHFPEARRRGSRKTDWRRNHGFDQRCDLLIGCRGQRQSGIDVERAPVDRAVDLCRREGHLVSSVGRQARADRQRVFEPRRIPRVIGRAGRFAAHRVVPLEPRRGRDLNLRPIVIGDIQVRIERPFAWHRRGAA